jgi:hypothetical protein
MKSERGRKNMLAFNAERQKLYVNKIDEALNAITKSKIKFTTVEELRKLVITQTGIAGTTFDRNQAYAEIVAAFFDSKSKKKPIATNKIIDGKSPEALRAKILELELIVSNLEEKNRQFEVSHKRNAALLKKQKTVSVDRADYYSEFSDTAIALSLLLSRHQDIVTVNKDTGSIENVGGRPSERVIVEPLRAAAFVKWSKDNSHLLNSMLL